MVVLVLEAWSVVGSAAALLQAGAKAGGCCDFIEAAVIGSASRRGTNNSCYGVVLVLAGTVPSATAFVRSNLSRVI